MPTLKQLKDKGKELKPVVNIGKSGLTDSVVAQVERIVKQKKLIKVKFLKSYTHANEGKTSKDLAKELAEKTGSQLVESVGLVVVLAKMN